MLIEINNTSDGVLLDGNGIARRLMEAQNLPRVGDSHCLLRGTYGSEAPAHRASIAIRAGIEPYLVSHRQLIAKISCLYGIQIRRLKSRCREKQERDAQKAAENGIGRKAGC